MAVEMRCLLVNTMRLVVESFVVVPRHVLWVVVGPLVVRGVSILSVTMCIEVVLIAILGFIGPVVGINPLGVAIVVLGIVIVMAMAFTADITIGVRLVLLVRAIVVVVVTAVGQRGVGINPLVVQRNLNVIALISRLTDVVSLARVGQLAPVFAVALMPHIASNGHIGHNEQAQL